MRTSTLGKALAVTALLLAPWLAQAAGLGGLRVQSSLGQPLAAEIDMVAVRPGEVDSLNVRLGPPDAYQQANLQYNAGLTGIRLSIEKRASGQYFIKVTGSRAINEPFIDLLIELTWSGGKLVREYTALLDPPGYNPPAQTAAAPTSAAVTSPAPPEARAIAAPIAPVSPPAAAIAARGAKSPDYGPVARGETLGKIASTLKPAGVSLEQMLVGLYRSNPDAFIRKNMNLVKSGRILRVPDAQELAAIPQAEAAQEFRTQVADWRAYSGRLADAAKSTQDSGSPARGRITASVDEGAAAGSKDVVRLSKGEPGKGEKPLTGAARARALQEELVARNKELAEASERITQLEKTIKDMQKLAELKNPALAAAQQKAESAKVEAVKPADTPKTDVTKAESAPKAEAKTEAKDAANATAAPVAETATAAAPPAEVKPVPAPKPKPKPAAPPPPPPEPEIMDMVMDNLPAVGGGVAALLLGGLGIAAMRRRRAQAEDDAEPLRMAPSLDAAGATSATAAAVSTATATPVADDVDPVAEAEVYIAYGRDEQAEEILKEAMGRDPAREDVQVKLAEVYAARKDAAAFSGIAQSLHGLTGGAGENWIKVAALGYALDAGNSLYAGGKDVALPADTGGALSTDIDFELGGDNPSNPDIALDAYPAGQATEWEGMRGMAAAAESGVAPAGMAVPDFSLDVPSAAAGTQTDIVLEAAGPGQSSVIDFNIDLPSLDQPTATNLNLQLPPVDDPTISSFSKTAPVAGADTVLDFKLDVGDLNINLDTPATEVTTVAQPLPGGKDAQWYDVQQKFDLAKAYQEMGDNEGAREILQEVIQEGDAEQKSQAQQLLGTLG